MVTGHRLFFSLVMSVSLEHRPDSGTKCNSSSSDSCSEASVSNQIKYFVDFYCKIHLGKSDIRYFWFEGIDSSWRRYDDASPDSVEGHFGIFDDQGNMKDHFKTLSFSCPGHEGILYSLPDNKYVAKTSKP